MTSDLHRRGHAPAATRAVIAPVKSLRYLSPFRYPGGKSWLADYARQWLRLEQPDVLLDPFTGGGTIPLMAAAEGLAGHVVMVELDDNVAAVWQTIIDGVDRDVDRLCRSILDFDLTLDNVLDIRQANPVSTPDRALRTIILNRTSRGGILAPGAGLIKAGEDGRGVGSRWYPETLVRRIRRIRQFSDRITFIQGDGLNAIPGHAGDAMFIDPPYTAGGAHVGARLYTHHSIDHERLFRLVDEHSGSALMTYDDVPETRHLAEKYGFNIGTADMLTTHHKRKSELVLTTSIRHEDGRLRGSAA